MGAKFDNLIKLLNLLDRGAHCTARKLSEELEVTERTVYRYLSSLQYAGFPIAFDPGRRSYTFERGFQLKKALMDVDEILVLALSRKLLSFLGEGFAQAFGKLEQKLIGVSSWAAPDLAASPIFLSPQEKPSYGDVMHLIKDLAPACQKHCLVDLTYQSLYAQEITQRIIEPYYLLFTSDGFWILRAFCLLREDWRTFALDRVRGWQILEKTFTPRPAMELQQELDQGFGAYLDGEATKVMVRFAPEISPYVERKSWHPSQQTRALADGGLEIQFETTGREAFKFWLYRWIPHIQAITPAELRNEILAELKEQLKQLKQDRQGELTP